MPKSTSLIVCGTDFSTNARRAGEVAAALARRRGGKLALVHVASESNHPGKSPKELQTLLRPVRMRLREEARHLSGRGAKVIGAVLSGPSAARAIIDYAVAQSAALVVVSSVSKTRFERWTLGNVSEHVAAISPIPTLVVRSPYALLEWARHERPLNVFVAVDFSISSDAALAWAARWIQLGNCAVTVVHVNWPPAIHLGRAPISKNPPAVTRQLLRDLEKRVKPWLGDANVTLHVEPNWGRPDAALVGAANAEHADLVVTGMHQRHGIERLAHGSVSRGVLRHFSGNVACVPTPVEMAHGVGKAVRLRRILVATDFSANGDQAVAWAYAALPVGGVIRLVHVVPPSVSPPPSRLGLTKGAARAEMHRQMTEARTRLAGLIPREAAATGVQTEIGAVVASDPARAISAEARRFSPDLLCLGSPAHGAWFETLRGSVVKRVMTATDYPMLLVPPAQP